MSQQRDCFRVSYPVMQRPMLRAAGMEFEIIDLSETGARIAWMPDSNCIAHNPFTAMIRFKDGTTAKTVARIQRQEHDHLILRFSESLPYSVIAAQQRRLLTLFPRIAT